MGKQIKKDLEKIKDGLDVQMNLAQDLVSRNPCMKDLYDKYPNRFIDKVLNPSKDPGYREFDELFKEIYGDIFPTFPFPVLQLEELEESPSEMVLRIDLNYTKDEIMARVKEFVDMGLKNYQKNRTSKQRRKVPSKWRDYLELWDLKNGDPPWLKDSNGIPFAPPRATQKKHAWTFEQIAKYKYPDAQTPQDLQKAVNRVKKQYRAACELIYGRKYDSKDIKKRTEPLKERYCRQCRDKDCIKTGEACPQVLDDLARNEVKQQHKLVSNLQRADIEKYEPIRKKHLSADKQFE